MKILSIHDGHNASAAIFDDDKILACVSEERINREKFYWGWPELSIKQVLKDGGLSLSQIDAVTVSHLGFWDYLRRKFSDKDTYFPRYFLGHMYNVLVCWKRERKIRQYFGQHGIKKYFFCDHHLAHAASAYYYSGFSSALVVTIDGQGDGRSHTAYEVIDGKWKFLVSGGSNASLGAFYGAVTEGLGFKPNRHEGKIVGLAAIGNPQNIPSEKMALFESINSDSSFKRKKYLEMAEEVKNLLKDGYSKEDISAKAQQMLEESVTKHILKYCNATSMKNLALAGGVFANVKLNQKLIENCPIEQIFIQPGMGDEGLILGSAAYYLHQNGIKLRDQIKDVYFGNGYGDEEIEAILKEKNYSYRILENPATETANMINNEKIIGWFDGRMEFGPRALGHRTIMADPRNKNINDILNHRLRRSEFMPFAPSSLYELADEVFENTDGSLHAAEFMTITFNVREKWHEKIRAVVHVDGTARPQLVKKEKNEAYYNVIKSFYDLTGIPLIVNTSFNIHEEPIVCSPDDALRSYDTGAVDCIVFNNKFLVSKD
ncbi:MAG: carbamoyltransferase C-terminal domain-containing protein [Candidatus Buchananbacteria bacterium]